jgi:uncharacterized membrane protein
LSSETEIQTRPRPRIESLSDLIFGLALSVGALTLVGSVNDIATTGELLNDIAVFGFSFLILISVWLRYTKIMSVLPLENRWVVSLNTALLFTVSIEPFLFNVLQLDNVLSKDSSSQVYAIDLGIMMAILGGFSLVLAREYRKLIPKDMVREFKTESATMFIAGALFLISTLPIFWTLGPGGLYWRFYLWIVPFALSAIRRRSTSIYSDIKRARSKSDLTKTS